MKYLGLIKWFDETKGFGAVGIPGNKELFIHKSNFKLRPEKLLKATALIFEIKIDSRGSSAINAEPPNSYEDFEIILSHLKEDPSISIELTTLVTEVRSDKQYKRTEIKPHNLLEYSLHQLLRKKQTTEVFDFFTMYYNKHLIGKDLTTLIKFLALTKNGIKKINFVFNKYLLDTSEKAKPIEGNKNIEPTEVRLRKFRQLIDEGNASIADLLIQELFAYYLGKIDKELLFEIWKAKDLFDDPDDFDHFNDDSNEDIAFKFPSEIFIEKHYVINYSDLRRILRQSKGIELVVEILNCKIESMQSISLNEINEILKSICLIDELGLQNQLRELFLNKTINLLSKCDFLSAKNQNIELFRLFMQAIKKESRKIDYENIVQRLNERISDEAMFVLWQATKYFQPDKEFFADHFFKIQLPDFIEAPNEFYEEYFLKNLSKIKEFETLENFCRLTFLIVETPLNKMSYVFPELSLTYQAAYWLNFPKLETDSYRGKYYQATYEISDIPYKSADFVSYLENAQDLVALFLASELINKIQNKYKSETKNYSQNGGFLKLDNEERIKLIQEFILKANKLSNDRLIELFKIALGKCVDEECVSLCKHFFPKFINKDIVNLYELVEVISRFQMDAKYKQEICKYLSEGMSKLEKVTLWFKGYTSKADFHEAIEVFDKFEINEQPNLLRKIFSLIQREGVESIENCLNIICSLAKNENLNLDIKTCLTVINSLCMHQNYIGENILSEIICKHVNESVTELVQVYDLFQECQGRTWMTAGGDAQGNWFLNIEGKEFQVNNNLVSINGNYYSFDKEKKSIEIDGESYPFKWAKKESDYFEKLYEKPEGITFCDAVRSQKDDTLNRHFYWCNNHKCYAPCQTDHIHLEWNKYSLRDFIKILKIPFEEDKYYRFVSIINRANRLMKKLKCNSCNHLLRDVKTSEFAFYRVTTFHCTNSACSNLHEIVYLNHCLNWKCLNVVDSRISTTCPNGWYICDSCDNCCSQFILEKKLDNLIINAAFNLNKPRHQKLKYQVDNKLGHMEREELYNYKTGKRINNE